MRRIVLVAICLPCLALLLACTGAAKRLFDLPGEFSLYRTDHHDCQLFNSGGGIIGGHVTHIGFDARHVLLRRDVAEFPSYNEYRLTGKIEYWIVEIETGREHGPYTAEEFATARERLRVRSSACLEPSDSSIAPLQQ